MSIDLSIRHLRNVVAVADAGGFTAAAAQERVAQSSLSRTVLEVERRVGVPLFARSTRRVEPTDDGREFLVIARRVLGEYDAAMRHFEGYLAGRQGSVTVAALPSLAASMLPATLAAYRAERPEITVTVRDGLSAEVVEMVAGGEVDLAVAVAPRIPAPLVAVPVAADRFLCVFAPGHRFEQLRRLSWHDLADEPFVAFDRTSSIRSYVDRTLADLGTPVGPVTQARNVASVAGLVAAGLGVSLVPALVWPLMSFAGLRRRTLADPVVEREIVLVRDPRRPLSRPATALRLLLEDAGRQDVALPPGARWL